MAKVNFTTGRVDGFACPPEKGQAFLWDSKVPGLGLRATAAGAKSYILQGKLHGATVRVTIGDVGAWTIERAQEKARQLQTLIDSGIDPREQAAEQRAAHEARKQDAKRKTVTLADAWAVYLQERASKWSALHLRDHVELASPGGVPKKRGAGLTEAGPLAALMPLKLSALTAESISSWLALEAARRPARARLAFNLLRICANWCESRAEYRGLIDGQALDTRIAKDNLPKRAAKTDVLQREQLPVWFEAIFRLDNPVMTAYLIGLLLTGARREELAELRWDDVDFRWRTLRLKDKVEQIAGREIPLTAYFSHLLDGLWHTNQTPPNVVQLHRMEQKGKPWSPSPWVFASSSSSGGRLVAPNRALHRVCEMAGIPPVTLHGLRRSFSSLAEWTETPVGVVAQIMGHKPSATAERHYKVRKTDLLRVWHDKLEAWVLDQAHVPFKPDATGSLSLVHSR